MSFSFSRSLTIDHTQCGASDSANFAVLVSATHSTLKTVGNGGHVQSSTAADVLFFSDSGLTTQLASEIDFYDPVNGVVAAWVKVGTVSHTVDTVIYVGYGNTSPPARTTNPWDANYKGVYHLADGTSLSAADSTSNANNGTQHNGVTAISGKIDGGASFAAASSQYISTSNVLNLAQVTIECWVFVTGNPASNAQIVGCANGVGNGTCDKDLYLDSGGLIRWYVFDGAAKNLPSLSSITTNAWVHLACSADGTTSRLYVNGSQVNSMLAGNTFASYTVPNFFLSGNSGQASAFLSEQLDEVRISTGARSADWILTGYNNQFAPGNIGSAGFLTWGAETTAGGGLFRPSNLSGLGSGGAFFQNPLN